MRARSAIVILGLGLALGASSSALGDVPIQVPSRFLGGPIPLPAGFLPASTTPPGTGTGAGAGAAVPCTAQGACVPVGDDAVIAWLEDDTDSGPPPDDDTLTGPCPVGQAAACVPVGDDAVIAWLEDDSDDGPDPSDPAPSTTAPAPAPAPAATTPPVTTPSSTDASFALPAPATPPSPVLAAALRATFGGLVAPGAARWLRWERPTLRWHVVPGVSYYRVLVVHGARRVMDVATSGSALTLPPGVLRQGRTYAWEVRPGVGPRSARRLGPPLGRSIFAVTLRPRLVLHGLGPRRSVAETRPHIPGGVIALTGAGPKGRRVRLRVVVRRDGLVRLPVARATAVRLTARLLSPGPSPPPGLRRAP